jgi:hypothetical protein
MPTPRSRRDEILFVIRTWKERDSGGEEQWRSSVTHVLTGDRRYFTSHDELNRFIDRWKR